MINWSVDIQQLKKNPTVFKIWKIEQMINFGLDNEKLDQGKLKKLWPYIKDQLDPYKKRFMEYILWKKVYSLPDNLTFWNLSTKTRK